MSRPVLTVPTKAVKISSFAFASVGQNSRICSQCAYRLSSISTRSFSTTRHNNAKLGGLLDHKNLDSKLPKSHSMRTRMKDAGKQELGNDLGRVPMSLVMPSIKTLREGFSGQVGKLAKVYWFNLKTSVTDWYGVFYFRWWDAQRDPTTGKKMRKPLELGERHETARQLHQSFNSALARGDVAELEQIACDGVLSQAKRRIELRQKRGYPPEKWQLRMYTGLKYPKWLEKWPVSVLLPRASTRVVSDKLSPLPLPESYIRQCVVRIRSVQTYELATEEDLKISKHTEYVVMQKLTFKGEDGPWRIWGTVEPSTIQEINDMLEGQDSQSSFTERLSNLMSGGFPGGRLS
ncbi:hypothetical protein A1O3_06179 [Capronia epimyces CBS 606.96]|uniref:Tim44-like domain-containing protein n=1 Tax=Capronia epimyces CBS 606.96 TaxID=1182542 RepID=W9XZJ5_9EURO|nr:uncharacterized protein A1O3_06179 [Capronia epimyces CBS 606.96]EXJ82366.1 hypothetical protein A1O3_06179 [Capronia epimyces CBS 606.96]